MKLYRKQDMTWAKARARSPSGSEVRHRFTEVGLGGTAEAPGEMMVEIGNVGRGAT